MEDQNLLVMGWPLDSPILEGRCVWIIHAEELCIFLTHTKQLFAGFWWSTTFLLSLKGEIFESLLLNHVISAILLGWNLNPASEVLILFSYDSFVEESRVVR